MKIARHAKILELIEKYDIETQDELAQKLCEEGFMVTQATVSRDIRELHISKMTTGRGTYRYVVPGDKENSGSAIGNVLRGSVVGVDHANNLVVIKTQPGLANAVAVGIDGMHMVDILGCVAGDDTILLVARTESVAQSICNRLSMMNKTI